MTISSDGLVAGASRPRSRGGCTGRPTAARRGLAGPCRPPGPIREIRFVRRNLGWAAGGNIYSGVGGLYFSSNGGQTWNLDLDSGGVELDACDHSNPGPGHLSLQVWCAGYDSSFAGKVYTLKLSASSG